ncbi:hypothetical protein [Jeotgalibaca ciconiae]|uniref:Uncharacterized protein n=1 Tax=Jeotgalibaca ciconiae TaxID=2496265 RepID=A0A3Q9BKG4_9LACT|nr:hypothetical protein [Jeotgalibaca ciconiae]AZP03959.1 hypothetical protein EJN90_04325 [Jeotgalibaca ciconiae]
MNESIRMLYNRIYKKMDIVHFESLWEGFYPFPFALYDDEMVYFADREIPWDERFLANTSISFEGEPLAIWNIQMDDPEDDDILLSNLIHEMFHCFQTEKGEMRFANDLAMLNYPLSLENFQLKHQENQSFVQIFRKNDQAEKEKYFANYVAIRSVRKKLIGEHFLHELKLETIEGAAEFVGLSALKLLDEKKFQKKIKNYWELLEKESPLLFDIRRICYYTGSLFYFALQELGYEWNQNLSEESPIYEQIEFQLTFTNVEIEKNQKISHLLESEKNLKSETLQSFLAVPHEEVPFGAVISGYDPMNMFRKDDLLYCSHFVYLKNKETSEKLFLAGPILLKMVPGSLDQVESYFIQK